MTHDVTNIEDLLDSEYKLFEDEYALYHVEGESKPKNIGKPFLLHKPGSTAGVLLIHGLMAAPEELRQWAEFLHSKNYSVYVIRVAGHGTSPSDLSKRVLNEWVDSVDRGYEILKKCCDNIVIGGFSAGAGLALYHAIKKPGCYDAVISISAPLQYKSSAFNYSELVNLWNILMGKLKLNFLCMDFVKNRPDNPEINYLKCSVSSIVQLRKLMTRVYEDLPEIKIPTIIMQATHDPILDKKNSKILYNRMNSGNTFFQEIKSFRHGIVRGDDGKVVFDEVGKFLNLVYLKKRSG
jgi:carboxylesterase